MEDITPKLLEAITDTYSKEASKNQKIKDILSKIEKGEADYEDLLAYAKELGNCLETAFRINVSEDILPDGKMYYNIAERLINPVVRQNYKLISERCVEVQTALNKMAKLGLKGIKPTYKQEKTDSIIDYISDADKYSEREKSFLQSLSTNAKSVVDDSVRENAGFHYKSGLSPKIIRRTHGDSCKWCQKIAGVYDYAAVKDTGNNVFRRHANCDCTVSYDPSNGTKKIQDVWSKKWIDNSKLSIVQNRLEEIENTKINIPDGMKDVTKIYRSKATPGKGKISYDIRYDKAIHADEIRFADFIIKEFGGEIHLLQEPGDVKISDYLWNGKKWDLKTPIGSGKRTIDNQFKSAKKQIESNPGGVFLDISKINLNIDTVIEDVGKYSKSRFFQFDGVDIMIVKDSKVICILRNTNIKK